MRIIMFVMMIMIMRSVRYQELTIYHSLDFVVMRFLMKLFCTSNSDIVSECGTCFEFSLPNEIIPSRRVKFVTFVACIICSIAVITDMSINSLFY